ncbi:MAG: hypothetical protein JO231_21330 [Acidobacteria bacterium]|nr:hypothetical protein [Acidobacteriota bacterium]
MASQLLLVIGNVFWALKVTINDVLVAFIIPWPALLFGFRRWVISTAVLFAAWVTMSVITGLTKMLGLLLGRIVVTSLPTSLPDHFVLYLRPFDEDTKLSPPPADIYRKSFEDEIAMALNPLPVIALYGDKMLAMWESRSMAFVKLKAAEWREAVIALASKATLVVVLGGESAGVKWEMKHLTTHIPSERVVLLVRRQRIADFEITVENVELSWEDDSVTRRRYEAFQRIFPKRLPRYVPGLILVTFGLSWTDVNPIVSPGGEKLREDMRTAFEKYRALPAA